MKIASRPTVELKVTIELTEQEAGALEALFGYSVEAFLKTFYKEMGESYLKPFEPGLRSLHENRASLAYLLDQARRARRVFMASGDAPREETGNASEQSPQAPAGGKEN